MAWATTWKLLLSLLLMVVTREASADRGWTIRGTCDDKILVYFNGKYAFQNSETPMITTTNGHAGCPGIVAIKCEDTGGVGGILATLIHDDTGTTYVTNSSWKCAANGVDPENWKNPDYDDSAWANAHEVPDNFWASQSNPGIAESAKWIWTTNWPIDKTVYCRAKLDCAEEATTMRTTTPAVHTTTTAPDQTTQPHDLTTTPTSSGHRLTYWSVGIVNTIIGILGIII